MANNPAGIAVIESAWRSICATITTDHKTRKTRSSAKGLLRFTNNGEIQIIGIARTFLVSGSINRPIHNIDDPWAKDRELDDKAYGLDHFFRKLLKLKDGMHTATARRMAEERHASLEHFLEALRKELTV